VSPSLVPFFERPSRTGGGDEVPAARAADQGHGAARGVRAWSAAVAGGHVVVRPAYLPAGRFGLPEVVVTAGFTGVLDWPVRLTGRRAPGLDDAGMRALVAAGAALRAGGEPGDALTAGGVTFPVWSEGEVSWLQVPSAVAVDPASVVAAVRSVRRGLMLASADGSALHTRWLTDGSVQVGVRVTLTALTFRALDEWAPRS
jgi:hypothetical protein